MTDALSTSGPKGSVPRPPDSGPGSSTAEWRKFAAQETGRTETELADQNYSRDQLIALVDHTGPEEGPKEAPRGVEVVDEPVGTGARGRPLWMTPVEGGYAVEADVLTAEFEEQRKRTAQRHEDALTQLDAQKTRKV